MKPTPRTWTIRFKIHRTTVVLYADPAQKLSTLKSELLKALKGTHPTGEIEGEGRPHFIPESIDEIVLGTPVDLNDLTVGWEIVDTDQDDLKSNGKGKGKAAAKKSNSTSMDTPQSAGLSDGGVVAVRFRNSKESNGFGGGELEDVDVDELMQKGGITDENDQTEWDVVVPGPPEDDAERDEDVSDIDDLVRGRSTRARTPLPGLS